ncbi:locomotion-related protein Hikaru genki [Chelonus insularis]|uniref:locomotion-related protein Hikaru genki n=1 Tax=Chelonus insularis TaxID=460826 RepID=UPI0015882BA5|nr:locomotion-related protein Hikaru genki [Chelonus insularis]
MLAKKKNSTIMTVNFNALWFFFLFIPRLISLSHASEEEISSKRDCKLEGLHPFLIITYKNITISADKITIPHSERVTMRCRELGKYKLVGDPFLQCRNGEWSSKQPYCLPTTSISNYTDNVPPTILFGLPTGSAAIEPSGALAVFPGSILHLECLFARRMGNPEWTWTSSFRQYLTGWAIAASEKDWKYRLSIYYVKNQDSGTYTCSTPKGLTNSIRINVVDIHCPTLSSITSPMTAKIQGTRMGHKAEFRCPDGYRLEGSRVLSCQYNGRWSNEVPRCERILCPEIVASNARLQILEHNNTVGGRASFTCMWGNNLEGPPTITCKEDGTWNASIPICSQIICRPPPAPKNGKIIEQGKTHSGKQRRTRVKKVGSLLRFACLPSHQLLGEASIICTENGTWSHNPPTCEVRCPYPGDPPHGKIAPLKFWYKPGDTIQVTCSPGYVTPLQPVKRPTCRENGVWSGPPPPCRSYRDV